MYIYHVLRICVLLGLYVVKGYTQDIIASLENPDFDCGEAAIITCNITNGTNQTAYWFQEGNTEPVSTGCTTDSDYIIINSRCSETEEFYAIEIHNTSVTRDSGNWTCVYGQGGDSLNLRVSDIPVPPNATLISGEVAEGQLFDIVVHGDCAYPEYKIAICFHEDVGCYSENVTCESECGPFQSVTSSGTTASCDKDHCDGESISKNVTFSARLKSKYSNGIDGEFYFIYTDNGWDGKVNKSQSFPFAVSGDDALAPGIIAAIVCIAIIGGLAILGAFFYLYGCRKGNAR